MPMPEYARHIILAGMLKAGLIATFLIIVPAACSEETPKASVAEVLTSMEVYKSATCGCCNKWIEHVETAGYSVIAHDTDKMSVYKRRAGVPASLQSCHTAKVEGYIIEGHVPAQDIARLLKERPDAIGLSVPGMVSGSPGMENGYSDPYDVILFKSDGTTEIYASY